MKIMKTMKKEKISLLPIIVQFLTVTLLFLTGFDVGLQNHVIVKQETPTVHVNFALSDHGIGALTLVGVNTNVNTNTNVNMNMNMPSQRPKDVISEELQEHNNDITIELENDGEEFSNGAEEEEEEEFAEVKPAGVTASVKEPNIDPVFKVDLDDLTAGDGFLMAAA